MQVKTLILSDLHLGSRSRADILRWAAAREYLFGALAGADRLVILGDALELREATVEQALEGAAPFFEGLREALGSKPLTMVPGNHDHQLVGDRLETLRGEAAPLGLEQVWEPGLTRPARRIGELLAGADVRFAYPGVWLREDVYATHGHYLDLHSTLPTVESLLAGATSRLAGGMPSCPRRPADYEAGLAPLYAFSYELAQSTRNAAKKGPSGPGVSARIWMALNSRGAGGRVRKLAATAVAGAALPVAVAGLNRAGIGSFRPDISLAALEQAGAEAMAEAVAALGIEAEHVIFGHTHRAGPRSGDGGWPRGGPQLWNPGSWVWSPGFVGERGTESPYWPGHAVVVEDEGPPRLELLVPEMAPRELFSRRN